MAYVKITPYHCNQCGAVISFAEEDNREKYVDEHQRFHDAFSDTIALAKGDLSDEQVATRIKVART